MKKLMLALLCLISSGLIAQRSEHLYPSKDPSYLQWMDNNYMMEGSEIYFQTKRIHEDKKGKETVHQYTRNKDGKLIDYTLFKKGSNWVKSKQTFDYDDEGRQVLYQYYKHCELRHQIRYVYNDLGKLSEEIKTDKKGEVVYRKVWEYNADSCVIASKYFNRRGLKRTWKYSYYSKNDKSKSELLNKKGKLIKTWSFDCKPEGEEVELDKKENLICSADSHEKGILIKTTETFDNRGKSYKTVCKYTSDDTTLVYQASYWKGRIGYENFYQKGIDSPVNYKYYRRNGKVRYSEESVVENGRIIEQTQRWRSKKKYTRQGFEYNEDGVILRIQYFDEKKKFSGEVRFEHTPF